MDTRLSGYAARAVIGLSGIDLSDFERQQFLSYNDFFTRRILPSRRPIATEDGTLISPCDGKLISYPVTEKSLFYVKHSAYSLKSLTKSQKIEEMFRGGTLLVVRLTVDDYHRYCYFADGVKSKNVHIPGVFHSVNPVALFNVLVFKENTREYCIIKTPEFKRVLMMEVGALLVGKIHNHHGAGRVVKGMEKGYFEFGGSSIVLCFEKGRLDLDRDIWENSRAGVETLVRMGERIGKAAAKG